ncbi:hypothetical protein [Kistimonas asteriae]|uniref:hypothetical protein n=1 Tax=Kistimonas asteriae TaxID=517724 RepID=UPI001BAA7094|nr:hypothetical protein [Kistimonas asteriae]
MSYRNVLGQRRCRYLPCRQPDCKQCGGEACTDSALSRSHYLCTALYRRLQCSFHRQKAQGRLEC